MYLQYDKQEAVKTVQKFLRKIYEDKYPIPISGYFDSVTKKATEEIQIESGLLPSGIINYETFEAITRKYNEILLSQKATLTLGYPRAFPIIQGKYAAELFDLNRIISVVLNYYGIPHNIIGGSFYSDATADAVRELQKIYLLPLNDISMRYSTPS